MERPLLEHTLEQLRNALEHDDLAGAANIIEVMRPADQADLFAELDEQQQYALLPKIAPEDSADILEELDDETVAELVEAMSNEDVMRIMDEMEPDEVADLLGDMHPERAETLLSGLEDPEEVRPLMIHADESAGGLMTTEFLVLRRRMTASEAIDAFRQWNPDAETIYYLYVADQFGRLSGVVNLRQLILADSGTVIMDLMETKIISVGPDTDQEEASQILLRYDLLALPVVNDQMKLLGVITVDDVMEVLENEATEDIQRYGGAQPLERPYLDTPVTVITRKRIGWLLLLFITATLTGSVMRLFRGSTRGRCGTGHFYPSAHWHRW